jgi:tryptophan synthase
LNNGVNISIALQIVKDARKRGLKAPVVFMGYYNPMLAYGDDNLIRDSKEAGVNGFIICDLPPEEAIRFRKTCSAGGQGPPDSH